MLKVLLSGNLGSDPEKRYTQQGAVMLTMRVGVNTRRKSGDEWEDHTDWFRIRMMGARAETLAEKLGKGMRVFVIGKLEIGEWETREGEKRTSLDVWADEVEYSSPRSDDNGDRHERTESRAAAAAASSSSRRPAESDADLEDLPF